MIIAKRDTEQLIRLIQNAFPKVISETPRAEQPPTDRPEQLLTIQEAAEFLSLTVQTMYSKVSKGDISVMKRSKRLYFSRTELLDYLKGRA